MVAKLADLGQGEVPLPPKKVEAKRLPFGLRTVRNASLIRLVESTALSSGKFSEPVTPVI